MTGEKDRTKWSNTVKSAFAPILSQEEIDNLEEKPRGPRAMAWFIAALAIVVCTLVWWLA